MVLAPIALFAFNRPNHLKKTIEALAANIQAKESELYVFSDAARSESDAKLVDEVREIISSIQGFKAIFPIIREKNLGLADSIASGVTMLMEKYGKAIILEDDIVTSPYFLEYMNTALDLYKDNEKVMHISGFLPPIDTKNLPDAFFLRQSSCWGWASWARSWKNFSRDGQKFISNFSEIQINEFNLDGRYDYWSQLLANENGTLKTWAVYWYATVFSMKGLCLHPKKSLVANIGFDGSGQNCGTSNSFSFKDLSQKIYFYPDANEVVENKLATKAFRSHFSNNSVTLATKLKSMIKRLLA